MSDINKRYGQSYIYGSEAPDFTTSVHEPIREEQRKTRVRLVKKRKKNAVKYKLFVMGLSIMISLGGLTLVYGYSSISEKHAKINILQKELQEYKNQTKIMETELTKDIDINKIYDIATTELGMIRPTTEHIIAISIEKESSTIQYGTQEKIKE